MHAYSMHNKKLLIILSSQPMRLKRCNKNNLLSIYLETLMHSKWNVLNFFLALKLWIFTNFLETFVTFFNFKSKAECKHKWTFSQLDVMIQWVRLSFMISSVELWTNSYSISSSNWERVNGLTQLQHEKNKQWTLTLVKKSGCNSLPE